MKNRKVVIVTFAAGLIPSLDMSAYAQEKAAEKFTAIEHGINLDLKWCKDLSSGTWGITQAKGDVRSKEKDKLTAGDLAGGAGATAEKPQQKVDLTGAGGIKLNVFVKDNSICVKVVELPDKAFAKGTGIWVPDPADKSKGSFVQEKCWPCEEAKTGGATPSGNAPPPPPPPPPPPNPE